MGAGQEKILEPDDPENEYSVARLLANTLSDLGVTHVFGGHGGAIMNVIDAIVNHPKLEWVYIGCETNAPIAAGAYAKLRNGLGVCISSSGPGASHMLSGCLDCFQDGAPV